VAKWKTKNPDRRLALPGSKFFSALAKDSPAKQRISLAQMLVDLPAALDGLPPKRREVLEARYFEKCTWPEMTRKFGKSENTIRIRQTPRKSLHRRQIFPIPFPMTSKSWANLAWGISEESGSRKTFILAGASRSRL